MSGNAIYREKVLKIPIYHGYLCIIETDDIELVNKKFDLEIQNSFYASSCEWKIRRKGEDWKCRFMVFNPNSSSGKITHGCIAHESLHAAHMIFKHKGVIPDFDNDEPLAYLLDWIVNETVKFLGYE